MSLNTKQDDERFWKYVNKKGQDDCWEWVGGVDPNGYGKFWFQGKAIGAHRFSLRLKLGVIELPYTCHKCDNHICVNPNHLFQGDPLINQRDMIEKGRMVKERKHRENYARGEAQHLSKLTWEKVKEIRSAYIPKKFGAKRISEIFGVSKTTIQSILGNKTWRDTNAQ